MSGIMLNEDCNHFLVTRYKKYGERIPMEEIEKFIEQYRGTDVSDFVFNVGGNLMTGVPSDIVENYARKYLQTSENGCSVDYKNTWLAASYDLLARRGIDLYAIWLPLARAAGMRVWVSLRLNDCHCNNEKTSACLADYFHDNPQLRRVRHRRYMRYFDNCLDYAIPAVRERILAHIAELLERYDMDGFELDWQREIYCFRPGEEYAGIEIINQFTRDVRALLDKAQERRGHRVLLAARTLSDPQKALECGFDVMTWAREGLIDVIVPTPRWASTDADMPVELWKRMLADYPVEIAAGVEIIERSSPKNDIRFTTLENVNALAAAYLTTGADKLYLFNYMDCADGAAIAELGDSLAPENYARLLRTLGRAETAVASERRHMVTYSDIGPEWFDAARRAPLPLASANAGDVKFLRVRVGEVPAKAKVELRLGADSGEMEVYVNSRPARYARREEVLPAYTKNPAWVFDVENDGKLPPFLVVEIIAKGAPVTVDYVEAHVRS